MSTDIDITHNKKTNKLNMPKHTKVKVLPPEVNKKLLPNLRIKALQLRKQLESIEKAVEKQEVKSAQKREKEKKHVLTNTDKGHYCHDQVLLQFRNWTEWYDITGFDETTGQLTCACGIPNNYRGLPRPSGIRKSIKQVVAVRKMIECSKRDLYWPHFRKYEIVWPPTKEERDKLNIPDIYEYRGNKLKTLSK